MAYDRSAAVGPSEMPLTMGLAKDRPSEAIMIDIATAMAFISIYDPLLIMSLVALAM
ncbi:hypothetical protein ACVIGB_004258 [Bradyrhizobium sp. USDA 4341]